MVLVGDGCTEEGHDAIAGELIDGPLEPMHPLQEDVKAAIHEGMDLLGIEALREAGKPGHVGNRTVTCLRSPSSALREVRIFSAQWRGV